MVSSTDESKSYDIALLPTVDLAERAIRLSAQLQHYGAWFELSSSGPFPHVSLYMVQLKTSSLDLVQTTLSEIAALAMVVDLVAREYHQPVGYIDVAYHRTGILDALQMAVVNAINPLRDGLRKNDEDRVTDGTLDGAELVNVEKYGYRYIGELFRPHLTFTRFREGSIDEAVLPALQTFDGACVKLGIFELGDHGTCARSVAEFDLAAKVNS